MSNFKSVLEYDISKLFHKPMETVDEQQPQENSNEVAPETENEVEETFDETKSHMERDPNFNCTACRGEGLLVNGTICDVCHGTGKV